MLAGRGSPLVGVPPDIVATGIDTGLWAIERLGLFR
jgi:hypothetical protein